MDWTAAIDKHREALKRVLAMLVAMASLPVLHAGGDAGFANPDPHGGGPKTLPRHLHRAVLRLLRPAEAAMRRLVIVAARGLVVERSAPRERPRKPKPLSTFLRRPGGTGILLPRGMAAPGLRPRPAPRAPALPLFDPLPRWEVRPRPAAGAVPRILSPGFGAAFFPVARPLSPDDPLDAGRIHRRLAALRRALDDLPREARRFARWRALSRDAADKGVRDQKTGRSRRLWPLRPGRPPGSRPAHAVHQILNDLHGLAFWVLERPDTS